MVREQKRGENFSGALTEREREKDDSPWISTAIRVGGSKKIVEGDG